MYALSFLVVLVTLVSVKKKEHKPYCVVAGILCTMACSIYSEKLTLFQCITTLVRIMQNVLIGNYSLFITLLLFGVLIRIIAESGALEDVAIKLNCAIRNKIQFFGLLIVCALVASVDDYLACILLVMILTTCYEQFGLTKSELGFFVNTAVVAFCSTVPISTWAPVITEALTSGNRLISDYSYLRYCFNYFTVFSLLGISTIFLMKKSKQSKHKERINIIDGHACGWSILLIAVGILYTTYIVSSNSGMGFLSDNALLISCISTLLFCHMAFLRFKKINPSDIGRIYVEGSKDMLDLVKFLGVLWIYTACLEDMLHINETIIQQVNGLNLPIQLLPVAVFIFSGIISYCTGSVFATVRLLVPISITLGIGLDVGESYLWLIATAAINGSLLASVSPLSDTMYICSEKLNQNNNTMYRAHLPYSLMIILLTATSYMLAGSIIEKHLIAAVVLPVLFITPILGIYICVLPYIICLLKNGERELYYEAGLFVLHDIKDVIRKYVKHSRWYVKQIFMYYYQPNSPIRVRYRYKCKIC